MALLIFLMLMSAIAEISALLLVMPFLNSLQGGVEEEIAPGYFVELSALDGAFILCSALIGGLAFRVATLYFIESTSHLVAHGLGVSIFRKSLHRDYSYYANSHSSEVVAGINKIDAAVIPAFRSGLNVLFSGIVGASIAITLFLLSWQLAAIIFATILVAYACVSVVTKPILKQSGIIIADALNVRYRALAESLNGIRDVLLHGYQKQFINEFSVYDKAFRKNRRKVQILTVSPSYIIDTVLMLLVVVLALWAVENANFANHVPVLGAFAIGGRRLMPHAQNLYGAAATFRANFRQIDDVSSLVRSLPNDSCESLLVEPLEFSKTIVFDNVSFAHGNGEREVFEELNWSVDFGSTVAIVGATGSGKSTFLNLLLGLMRPTSGRVLIDGQLLTNERSKAWQLQIAHVSQAVHLFEGTVLKNIAMPFGGEAVDYKRAVKAATIAQLHEEIMQFDEGYNTLVGEAGAKLSGGQKQRLGIARALYREAAVLVFDEATSALDEMTEKALVEELRVYGQARTCVLVTHRPEILNMCDKVYELKGREIHLKVQQKST